MEALADIFTGRANFDPRGDVDAFFLQTPAKASVALLLNASGEALQLICTKNLRALMRRRFLQVDSSEGVVGKRVDYRSLVRCVAWCRVDSEFEMDLVYVEAARRAFPGHWRTLIPDRVAHFVSIDPTHPHPDFVRSADVARRESTALFGPFADRAKADRWVEAARDVFDLCRYRAILAQAPNGRACAYKQMNKCPAPCDGTIALEDYRAGVAKAVATIRAPATRLSELGESMKTHAQLQQFEEAGRLKSRLAALTALGEGSNRAIRPIDEFSFVSIQSGPRKGTAKLFLITAETIAEIAGLRESSAVSFEEVETAIDRFKTTPSAWPREVHLGMVAAQLTGTRSCRRFVARSEFTPAAFASLISESIKPTSDDASGDAIRETRLNS